MKSLLAQHKADGAPQWGQNLDEIDMPCTDRVFVANVYSNDVSPWRMPTAKPTHSLMVGCMTSSASRRALGKTIGETAIVLTMELNTVYVAGWARARFAEGYTAGSQECGPLGSIAFRRWGYNHEMLLVEISFMDSYSFLEHGCTNSASSIIYLQEYSGLNENHHISAAVLTRRENGPWSLAQVIIPRVQAKKQ